MKFFQGIRKIKDFQKPWQQLLDYVKINYDHLGLLLVEENQLTLWEVIKTAEGHKLTYQQQLTGADQDFWSQACFSLLEGLAPEVPVIVVFHHHLTVEEEFFYPEDLKTKEIHNSLSWDIKKLPDNYTYAWELIKQPGEYVAKVRGVEGSLVSNWQEIIKNNHRQLLTMVVGDEENTEFTPVTMAKALVEEDKSDIYQAMITSAVAQRYALLPKEAKPCSYQWRQIAKVLTATVLCITGLCIGSWQMELHGINKASNRAQANSQLKQEEMNKLTEVKKEMGILQNKLVLADKLRKENTGFYSLVQAVATANVEGVAVVRIQLDKQQLNIEGDSFSYPLLNEYQGNLQKLPRVKKLELVSAQRVDNEKIHFVIQGEVQ